MNLRMVALFSPKQSISSTFAVVGMMLCGCALNRHTGSPDSMSVMTTIYAQTVEYENGNLPLDHMNLVWAKRELTLENGRKFWELYGEFRGEVGSEAAQGWLSALITSRGVCSILASPHIRAVVGEDFLKDEIGRSDNKTRYFHFVTGDPIQWTKSPNTARQECTRRAAAKTTFG